MGLGLKNVDGNIDGNNGSEVKIVDNNLVTNVDADSQLNVAKKGLKSRLTLETKTPLIVHISSFGGVSYSFNVAYGVGKAGVDKMAKDMHQELKPLGIACIALYPGTIR
jgi:NAD(P)-dependent dehydrogenase (short-subunit alcohol dehydrogenase family)